MAGNDTESGFGNKESPDVKDSKMFLISKIFPPINFSLDMCKKSTLTETEDKAVANIDTPLAGVLGWITIT